MANFPPCPDVLKAIQPYLKIASEHDKRDPVISYWCRMSALQNGLKIDKSQPDSKKLLTSLMDWLEVAKKSNSDAEEFTNETIAQAHIENYTLKLFLWADNQDRSEIWNKNVIKAFYTSYNLFGLLKLFGEQPEEILKHEKYAKWKAAYIHNCLKNNERPIPGPLQNEDDLSQEDNNFGNDGVKEPTETGLINFPEIPSFPTNQGDIKQPSYPGGVGWPFPTPPSSVVPPNVHPVQPSANISQPSQPYVTPSMPATIPVNTYEEKTPAHGIQLTPEQTAKAQKYCKFASSALNYEDNNTAVMYLNKALKLLTTGIDD